MKNDKLWWENCLNRMGVAMDIIETSVSMIAKEINKTKVIDNLVLLETSWLDAHSASQVIEGLKKIRENSSKSPLTKRIGDSITCLSGKYKQPLEKMVQERKKVA